MFGLSRGLQSCGPVVDGVTLAGQVGALMWAGRAHRMPLLGGLTNSDAALFVVGQPTGSFTDANYSKTQCPMAAN
jgi:hypothetical protein